KTSRHGNHFSIACAASKTSSSTLRMLLRRSFSSKRFRIVSGLPTKSEIKSKPFVSKKAFAKSTSSEPRSIGLRLQSIQTFGQISQGAETSRLVFVDPTLGNLLQRRRVEIMQFFAAAPKGNNQVRFDK